MNQTLRADLSAAYQAVGLPGDFHEKITKTNPHLLKEYISFLHSLGGNGAWGLYPALHMGFEVETLITRIKDGAPYAGQNILRSVNQDFTRSELCPAVGELAFPSPVSIADFETELQALFQVADQIDRRLHQYDAQLVFDSYTDHVQPKPDVAENPHYKDLLEHWSEEEYQHAARGVGIHFNLAVPNLQAAIDVRNAMQRRHMQWQNLLVHFLPKNDRKRVAAIKALNAWYSVSIKFRTPWEFFIAMKSRWAALGNTTPVDLSMMHANIMIKPGRVEVRDMGTTRNLRRIVDRGQKLHAIGYAAIHPHVNYTSQEQIGIW